MLWYSLELPHCTKDNNIDTQSYLEPCLLSDINEERCINFVTQAFIFMIAITSANIFINNGSYVNEQH